MKFVALFVFFVGAFCLSQPSQEKSQPSYHSPPKSPFIPLNCDAKSQKLFESNPKLVEFSKRLDSLNGTEIVSPEDREILEELDFRGVLGLIFPPCKESNQQVLLNFDIEIPIWKNIFDFCEDFISEYPFPRAFKIFIGLEDYHNLNIDELIESFKFIGLARGDGGILRISERMYAIRKEYSFPSFFMPFIANHARWDELKRISLLFEEPFTLYFDRMKFFLNQPVSISFLTLLFDYHFKSFEDSNGTNLNRLEKICLHNIIFDQASLKAFERLLGKVTDSVVFLEMKGNELEREVQRISTVFQFNNLKELCIWNSSLFNKNFQFKNHENYTRLCLYDRIEFLNETKEYFVSNFTCENLTGPFLDLIENQKNLKELRVSPFLDFYRDESDTIRFKSCIITNNHLKILEFKPPIYLMNFFPQRYYDHGQIEELILQEVPYKKDWLSLLVIQDLKSLRIEDPFEFSEVFSILIQNGRLEKIYVRSKLIEPIKKFLTSMKSQVPRRIELYQIIDSCTGAYFDSLVYTYEYKSQEKV